MSDKRLSKVKKEIDKLRQEINHHSHRYYVLDSPLISDFQYDMLLKDLELLEKKFPQLVSADSPTQRVGGAPLEGFAKVNHSQKMLSLDNVFDPQEFLDFTSRIYKLLPEEKVEFMVEPKLDGVAIELIYENGHLKTAATRGDGAVGENVTSNIRTIKSVPLVLYSQESDQFPSILEVRGEIFIGKTDFSKLNQKMLEQNKEPFANPRNAAAGSIRQLDSRVCASRPLDMFCHSPGGHIDDSKNLAEFFLHVKGWGLKINPYNRLCHNQQDVVDYYYHLQEIREGLPYEIDGLVIKINSFEQQKRLGTLSKSPRWAIAFKFEPMQQTTVVEDIIVQVGRTGVLTPVAILSPAQVGGVMVNRATLHNQEEIEKKDIRLGDTVLIQRAGDVIPEVVKVIKEKRQGDEKIFKMPLNCPSCGELVFQRKNEIAWRCTNPNCRSKIVEAIKHFVSRTALNIEGLGEKIIEQLVGRKIVRQFLDLYNLNLDQIISLDRMGQKSSENILAAIENSKQRDYPFYRLLFSLGTDQVGLHTAGLLAKIFPSPEKLFNASIENLQQLDGIGPVVAKSICQFYSKEENRHQLSTLYKLLNMSELQETPGDPPVDSPLTGKTVVITGTIEGRTRNEARDIIEKLGGKVVSSVSKKTNLLLTGEKAGSKLNKAKKLGIQTSIWLGYL